MGSSTDIQSSQFCKEMWGGTSGQPPQSTHCPPRLLEPRPLLPSSTPRGPESLYLCLPTLGAAGGRLGTEGPEALLG